MPAEIFPCAICHDKVDIIFDLEKRMAALVEKCERLEAINAQLVEALGKIENLPMERRTYTIEPENERLHEMLEVERV